MAKPRKKTGSILAQTPPAQTKPLLLCGSLLILLTITLYYPVHSHPFSNYDDLGYVTENPQVQSGLSWQTVTWAFTTYHESNWHPLTWLSHALDYQLFRLAPAGHHDVNLLWHAVNAVLLFFGLWRATGRQWPSFMVAALFAVHPLNVESVAWVAERKNLLSMFFFLLALEAYRRYVYRPGTSRYVAVVVLFACGLMAKPQVITLPLVLLLWDYWPLRCVRIASDPPTASALPQKPFWWLVREKLPLFIIAGMSALITVKAQRAGGAVTSLQQHPLSTRMANAVVSYALYLGKTFWPSRLAPLYPYPSGALPKLPVVAALLLLIVVSATVIRYRQHRYLLVGWLWFLGTLVPMIGLVQVGSQAMADRYFYLPGIGLFIAICWGIAEWARQQNAAAVILPAISVVVLLALMVISRRQIDYWQSNVSLWTHTIQVTKPNYIAEDNLGAAFLDDGQFEPAMQHFRASLAIFGDDPTSLFKIAMYQQQRKNWPAAIATYNQLLGVVGNAKFRARALTNLGWTYLDDKDPDQAFNSWQQAVALDPASARAWVGLGVVAQRRGELDLAIKNYSRGVSLEPSDVGYILLAGALEKSGKTTEAEAARDQARRLSQNLNQAQGFADRALAP